jgi:hypothetical protein
VASNGADQPSNKGFKLPSWSAVVDDGAVGAVAGGVVGLVVLPAPPDHVEPGAGEDPDGVRVAVPAGPGPVIDVRGPGVGEAGVGGEVADRVAELFVRGPPERGDLHLAGLAGRGGDPG